MKKLNFEDFLKKCNFKNDTLNESEIQRNYKDKIYPRDSISTTNKRFVNIDDGSQGGSHWTCFMVKGKKSYYFDTFGSQPDNFSLSQLPKPIINHNYKLRDINSE